MKCLNLLDIELSLDQDQFEHLVRVDNIYVGSKVTTDNQIEYLKSLGIEMAIDLKGLGETEFDDKSSFQKMNIEYFHFPITDLGKIDFSMLQNFGNMINNKSQKIFVYCASGNRVGLLLALNSCLICGHPKKRAFDFGVKIGMNRETTQLYLKDVFERGGFF